MKWVTRERARVDRIACPWLISRFVDKEPTFLEKYKLEEPALQALARIVRGADTDARQLTPESAGLYAFAAGLQAIARDDHDNMAKQFPAYDALYAYCRSMAGRATK
jgi:hypothetical protein